MILLLGCASAEKPPVVVVAAAPSPDAAKPTSTASTTAAPDPASAAHESDAARIDSPLWRSTAPQPEDTASASSSPSSTSRREQLLAGADGLMEGDLTRAEQVCAARPEAQRRECIDAFLAQRMGDIGLEMDRSLKGLDLLERAGEKRCPTTSDTERHNECVLAEMERMVTELAPACANKSGEAQHRCIIDEVFRQLGP